jgi:hypothetical protein
MSGVKASFNTGRSPKHLRQQPRHRWSATPIEDGVPIEISLRRAAHRKRRHDDSPGISYDFAEDLDDLQRRCPNRAHLAVGGVDEDYFAWSKAKFAQSSPQYLFVHRMQLLKVKGDRFPAAS